MVDIVMATYNGANHLAEQLDSIARQDYGDWRLLVRDDVSGDATPERLQAFAEQHPDRVVIIGHAGRNLGACRNFSVTAGHATAAYTMFADQDDVWHPDKIRKTLARMQELERSHGSGVPLLVHTDFTIVDRELREIAGSGWAYQQIDPVHGAAFNRLLVQNVPTGCTMMINRPLRELALPIPRDAVMHDWWLGLVAAKFGHIGCLDEPTLRYRQHGSNVTGAVPWGLPHMLRQLAGLRALKAAIRKQRGQARAFRQRYQQRLGREELAMLDIYGRLDELGFLARRYYIIKYGFFYAGFARNLGMLILC